MLPAYTQECANFVHEKLPATSYELIIAIQALDACHGNSTKPRTNPNKFAPRADKRESSAGSNSSSGLGSEKNDCVSSISHTELICHMCHKPGHKTPDCPLRKDSNNDGYFRKSVKSLSLSKSNLIGAV